jgi:hypothetical protein
MGGFRRKHLSLNHRTRDDLIAFIAIRNYMAGGFERSPEFLFILNSFYILISIQKVRERVSIHLQFPKVFAECSESDRIRVVGLVEGDFRWFPFVADKCPSRARVALEESISEFFKSRYKRTPF